MNVSVYVCILIFQSQDMVKRIFISNPSLAKKLATRYWVKCLVDFRLDNLKNFTAFYLMKTTAGSTKAVFFKKEKWYKKAYLILKAIINMNLNSKHKLEFGFYQYLNNQYKLPLELHWPVATSDACSTSSCWLFILLIVMGIHMGFSSFFLQDLPKFIYPNASKKCCCFLWLLNHPLKNRNINNFSDSENGTP